MDRIASAFLLFVLLGLAVAGAWFVLLELNKREPVIQGNHERRVIRIPR